MRKHTQQKQKTVAGCISQVVLIPPSNELVRVLTERESIQHSSSVTRLNITGVTLQRVATRYHTNHVKRVQPVIFQTLVGIFIRVVEILISPSLPLSPRLTTLH